MLRGSAASNDHARLPGRLHWRVALHLDAVDLALRADCCNAQAQRVQFSPLADGWRATLLPSEFSWPLDILEGLGTPWNTLHLRGTLRFSSPGISLSSRSRVLALTGSMALRASQLRSPLSGVDPFGSYGIDLQGGPVPTLQIQTFEGPLKLSGQGHWSDAKMHILMQTDSNFLAEVLRFFGLLDGVFNFAMPT